MYMKSLVKSAVLFILGFCVMFTVGISLGLASNLRPSGELEYVTHYALSTGFVEATLIIALLSSLGGAIGAYLGFVAGEAEKRYVIPNVNPGELK